MRLSMGLRWGLLLCSGGLLSACLVGKDDIKNYTISLPSQLPIYADGHYINFSYELYQVPSSSFNTSTQGGIEMTWKSSSLTLPFGLGFRTQVLQHQVTETNFEGERISIQYLTQDSSGSVFLNAFKGSSANSSYWPADLDGVLSAPDAPLTKTILTSPIDDGTTGGSLVGVGQHLNQALDFDVMGLCTSTSCTKVARFTFSDYTIVGIDNIQTPLGNMEAYRLRYSGVLSPEPSMTTVETAYFDYRVSCGTAGSTTPVTFVGDVWIYPPIGPVKLRNLCNSGSRTVNFVAQINSTNLPH